MQRHERSKAKLNTKLNLFLLRQSTQKSLKKTQTDKSSGQPGKSPDVTELIISTQNSVTTFFKCVITVIENAYIYTAFHIIMHATFHLVFARVTLTSSEITAVSVRWGFN